MSATDPTNIPAEQPDVTEDSYVFVEGGLIRRPTVARRHPGRPFSKDITTPLPRTAGPAGPGPLLDRIGPGAADQMERELNSLVALDNAEQEAIDAARGAIVHAAQVLVAALTEKGHSTTKAVEDLVLTVNALKDVTP